MVRGVTSTAAGARSDGAAGGRAVDAALAGDAAETLLKIAVLLQAGVAPARAWEHLAASGDPAAVRVCDGVASGMRLPAAIASAGEPAALPPRSGLRRLIVARAPVTATVIAAAWRDVAAAWEVATAVGAPLAQSLRGLAGTLRDAQEASDDIRVALAEPAATAKLMGWLPLVAVLLGVALGFDTLGTLVGNPLGIVCLIAGGALIVAGQRWNAVLVRRARAGSGIPGLDAEMLAIALSGGVSIERARGLVAAARSSGKEGAQAMAAVARTDDAETDAVMNLSRTAGVPAVELLRASAALTRHRARIDGRLRAARLSSRLLLPLGVCTLPAFLFLGVAPMLLSVMTSVSIPL